MKKQHAEQQIPSTATTEQMLKELPFTAEQTDLNKVPDGFHLAHDSLGPMLISDQVNWGAQTQRSLQNFPIGSEKMPLELVYALVLIKEAAALTNAELGRLSPDKALCIQKICTQILEGKHDREFPLSVWQTGSGTQTNMNVNEVIAALGNNLQNEDDFLHPNDHVNCSQSSNDTFPTAMHIAAVQSIQEKLLPALDRLIFQLINLEHTYPDLIKTGRTHLQDAVPIKFSQEVSGWRSMFEHNKQQIEATLPGLYELALGGTAVGTGLNTPAGFADRVTAHLAAKLGLPFVSAPNKMHALSSKDEFAFAHGALRSLAANWLKFVNDIRWLASGPRCGLGELLLPENEPGSSIMPGKINPTQCESASMVSAQIFGNDTTIAFCASQGNFELNVYLPVCIFNFLQSVQLLSDSLDSFRIRCLEGLKANEKQMERNLEQSLMLVTALNPHIGYEKAAHAARHAHLNSLSLQEAVVSLGYLTAEEFKNLIRPEKMV